jgi:hypothetical protein
MATKAIGNAYIKGKSYSICSVWEGQITVWANEIDKWGHSEIYRAK